MYIAFFCIPPETYRGAPWMLLIIMFFAGIGTSLPFTLPDAILGDIIDYDEMRTGERNEGMYTVVETNLQQFVEIAGGVVPLLILGGAGYAPIGGCSCGCGIPCDEPYLRWECPADVGYSCTGNLGEELLYATEPAVAPCAYQSAGVQWIIQVFLVGLPGVLALLAGWAAVRQPITRSMHEQIQQLIRDSRPVDRQASGGSGVGAGSSAATSMVAAVSYADPVTGQSFRLPLNSPLSLLREHFSAFQLDCRDRLPLYMGARTLLWAAIVLGLLITMGVTGEPNLVTIGCLILTVLLCLLPWDGYRLYLVLRQGHRLQSAEVSMVQEHQSSDQHGGDRALAPTPHLASNGLVQSHL